MHDELSWFTHEVGRVTVAFSDARTDLGRSDDDVSRTARLRWARSLGADDVAAMTQVHGADVVRVGRETPRVGAAAPRADALVTAEVGVALLVRVADCAPVVLVDTARHEVAVVHAGRDGLVKGVVPAAVTALRGLDDAAPVEAWVGPRVCGRCYELPADLADAVEEAVPGTRSTTSWGTPAVDVGAGVVSQLHHLGVTVHDVGADVCTIEDEQFWSHRRQGDAAGRMGAAVVIGR